MGGRAASSVEDARFLQETPKEVSLHRGLKVIVSTPDTPLKVSGVDIFVATEQQTYSNCISRVAYGMRFSGELCTCPHGAYACADTGRTSGGRGALRTTRSVKICMIIL